MRKSNRGKWFFSLVVVIAVPPSQPALACNVSLADSDVILLASDGQRPDADS